MCLIRAATASRVARHVAPRAGWMVVFVWGHAAGWPPCRSAQNRCRRAAAPGGGVLDPGAGRRTEKGGPGRVGSRGQAIKRGCTGLSGTCLSPGA